jgi:hypothetical protein
MRGLSCVLMLASLGAAPRGAPAQERDLRGELTARGAPPAFVDAVQARVDEAVAAGLPGRPMAEKAIEGWAKHVPLARVETALDQVRAQLVAGRDAVVARGYGTADAALVAAAGEALGRGMTRDDVDAVLASAPTPEAAATGLTVAAAMAAQGLDRAAAIRAVRDALRGATDPTELYELPSAVADLTGHGMPMGEVARRIMQGGGLPLPPMAGSGQGAGRPPQVPPGPGKGQGTGKQPRRK